MRRSIVVPSIRGYLCLFSDIFIDQSNGHQFSIFFDVFSLVLGCFNGLFEGQSLLNLAESFSFSHDFSPQIREAFHSIWSNCFFLSLTSHSFTIGRLKLSHFSICSSLSLAISGYFHYYLPGQSLFIVFGSFVLLRRLFSSETQSSVVLHPH